MAKCYICSKDIEPGRGIIFVTAKGKILNFCSRKCRQAYNLQRSKKLGWLRKKKKQKQEKKE